MDKLKTGVKSAAALAVTTALLVTTAGAFNGVDLKNKQTAEQLLKKAGASFDIENARGILHIQPSELLTPTKPQESPVPTPEEQPAQKVSGYTNLGIANVDNYLNIRETPGEDGKLCGKLPQNTGCEILEEVNGWYKISSGSVTGYVKSEYLLSGAAAWEKSETVKMKTATVTTQNLYVREQPNVDCKILTLVPLDEELEVLDELEEWAKVKLDNDEGYVNKAYISIEYKLPKAVALSEIKESSDVSGKSVSIVQYAKQFLGNRYVYGGTSLTKGTDCSGFTMSIYAKFGISLPRSSSAQSKVGTKVSASEAKPGDLFFYGKGSSVNHVAMYIGNGQVIHASTEKTGIKISNAFYRKPIAVRRLL